MIRTSDVDIRSRGLRKPEGRHLSWSTRALLSTGLDSLTRLTSSSSFFQQLSPIHPPQRDPPPAQPWIRTCKLSSFLRCAPTDADYSLSGSNKSTQLHPDFSLESRRDRRRERSSSPIVPISSSPVSSPPQKKERKDFYDFSRLPAGFARPSASPSPTQSRAKKEKSWQERAWDRCWDVQGEAFTRAIDNAEGKIDLR